MLAREAIGVVLRDERIHQKKTLRQVSSRSGLALGYLSEVERGLKEPSSEMIEAICGSLYLEVDTLLMRSAERLRQLV